MLEKLAEIKINVLLDEEPNDYSEYRAMTQCLREINFEEVIKTIVNESLAEKKLPKVKTICDPNIRR